jgi:hypothetical protein
VELELDKTATEGSVEGAAEGATEGAAESVVEGTTEGTAEGASVSGGAVLFCAGTVLLVEV